MSLVSETEAERDMRTPESVIITMDPQCVFTLPTISSDSSYGDTMTYVRFGSPVTLSFSGQSAPCLSESSVTYAEDGSSIPAFFTFTAATEAPFIDQL